MEDADMGKESSLQDIDDYGDFSSSETEDSDMDFYGGYGLDRMTVFWNLEDYPIPESAELVSILPCIMKALALMGFDGHTEIRGYADHLKYDEHELSKAAICCSPSMLAAYMPMSMIVHAQSRRTIRERQTLFVIANQIPGTELHRVQQCLNTRGYKVVVVNDPSKQALFQSAESLVDCTRFLGAPQPVSRSGRAFFSGEKPISTRRFAELQDELKQVLLGGGYSAGYASYVSSLCQTIAMGQELILEDIIGRVRYICPIDDDLCRIIDKVLCERGFTLNFFPEEDNAKKSPFHSDPIPFSATLHSYSYPTLDSYKDVVARYNPLFAIENFSKPITPVDTVLFWDVVDCPFPLCPDPDKIYRRLVKALREKGYRGDVTIWAYVDQNNGPWSGEYLRNKSWNYRLYFLPGGDKASRLRRMLNDTLLWKMDMLSAVDNAYTADVIVVSDQVREDAQFFPKLEYMRLDRFNSFLVTPTQDVNKPESLEWPRLLLDEAVCIGSTCESSECSPKRHKADDAAE